jgi:hypothetical protein
MSEETYLGRQRSRAGGERPAPVQYTARDFQLEVLSKLAEMQSLAQSLEESWDVKLEAVKDQRLVKFDSRALVALLAIALSITGYVIQEARNTARQDSEIETTKTRVMHLEQIAATNTEARIRTEVQLVELREGQTEIKTLIQAQALASKKIPPRQ